MPIANLKGPPGTIQTVSVPILPPNATASAAATNNGATAVTAVSDPNLRRIVDLRGLTKCKIMGRFGGAVAAGTRIRLQYHLGGNIAVVTGDAGWTTLAETAGSHTVNTLFYTAELTVPAPARIQVCIVRAVIFGGDSAADPTISCCIVDFYP